MMIRGWTTLMGLWLLAGCRSADTPGSSEHPPEGARTGSPYSTGNDSGASRQRIEGINTGIELEAPRRIPGVVAALSAVTAPGRQPDKANLTALRGDLGTLEDAMRNDLYRVGLADTGAFHALTDTISRELGGGPGGLAKIDPKDLPRLSSHVQRLIGIYHQWMRVAQK